VFVDGCGVPNGINSSSNVVVNGGGASGPDAGRQQSSSLLIVDARSYAAAVANRAKGGGCECQGLLPCFYCHCCVKTNLFASLDIVTVAYLPFSVVNCSFFFFRDTAYLFKTEMFVTFDIAVIVPLSALTCCSQEGHQTSSSRAPVMIGNRFVEPDVQSSRVVRTLLL